ncbi:MAG TPA: HupE/UreJ family protein [Verrucomicrobiae bacterium]|nr:HupE/UreJ family protein [Verrucomicrobiae bacterium]
MTHLRSNWRPALYGLACLLAILLPPVARPHPAEFTTLQFKVETDGRFSATLNIDILSFAISKPSTKTSNEELEALLAGPRSVLAANLVDAGDHFRHEVVIYTDVGNATIASWTLPDLTTVDAVLARKLQPRIMMPGEIAFSGILPAKAHGFSIRLPYVLGDTVHLLELPHGQSHDEPVSAGDYSSQVTIELKAPGKWDQLVAIGRYIGVGFRHIIPEGQDHILFVLGLFLFSARIKPLIWQVSAFTVAHSITLGLALYGVIRLPASITEPLIAASIVFVAVENLFVREVKPWRYAVVFCFGLIHGLGFASAFANVGLPRQDFLIGLVGFNLGVEGGQLFVILGAFLAVGWFRRWPWYRKVIVIPASSMIALIALFWTFERIF